MDDPHFDRFAQGFSRALDRCRFGGLLAAAGLAAGIVAAAPRIAFPP